MLIPWFHDYELFAAADEVQHLAEIGMMEAEEALEQLAEIELASW